MEQVTFWWNGRTARERIMLAILAAVLALAVGWYGVIAPLGAWAGAAETRRAEAAHALARAEAAAAALAARKPAAPGALARAVDASAQAAGVAIARRREDADGRLTVWIDGVEPRLLMQWLMLLRQGHGVGVAAMTASKGEAGLQVQVSLQG